MRYKLKSKNFSKKAKCVYLTPEKFQKVLVLLGDERILSHKIENNRIIAIAFMHPADLKSDLIVKSSKNDLLEILTFKTFSEIYEEIKES